MPPTAGGSCSGTPVGSAGFAGGNIGGSVALLLLGSDRLPAVTGWVSTFPAWTGPLSCFQFHGAWDLGLCCHAELELAECHGGWGAGAGGALGHGAGVMVILLVMAWGVLSTWVIC